MVFRLLVAWHHCSHSVSFWMLAYTKSLISITWRHACVLNPSTTIGSKHQPLALRYRFSIAQSSRCSSSFCTSLVLSLRHRNRSAQEPRRASRSASSARSWPACSWCTASLAWNEPRTTRLP